MTLNELKKRVDKLVAAGHGRRRVMLKVTDLDDGVDDLLFLRSATDVDIENCVIVDGDGWIIENKDGSERARDVVCISGG